MLRPYQSELMTILAGATPLNISLIDYQLDLDLDYIAISLNTNLVEGALGAMVIPPIFAVIRERK